jgi:hypothetical protein
MKIVPRIWHLSALLVATATLVAKPGFETPAHAAPRVPASSLITAKSIGPARLGMTLGALKRAFPGSVVAIEEGPVTRQIIRQNGRDIVAFTTREQRRNLEDRLNDRDIIASLNTSDPRFQLASGIRPGSWLHNAVKFYGRPRLTFWSHGEEATFQKWNRKISFEVTAPVNPKSEYKVAGFYSKSELERLDGTTTRFRAGTRITAIGCSE